jgi:rare lipoprotein A
MLSIRKNILKYLLFLFCCSLAGCLSSHTPMTKTASPQKQIDTHYAIHGKSYTIMHSGTNYEARGVASWYGRPFNHHYTSSGERYNMYSMTAAHKTLPLSSQLLVTNLLNGRHVIVRVNDRGPFVGNRLIDLSYAAAKKLGMVGRGLAEVDIKTIKAKA